MVSSSVRISLLAGCTGKVCCWLLHSEALSGAAGTLEWPDGQSYSGELSHNNIQGSGTLVYVDKSKYTGEVHQFTVGDHPD